MYSTFGELRRKLKIKEFEAALTNPLPPDGGLPLT